MTWDSDRHSSIKIPGISRRFKVKVLRSTLPPLFLASKTDVFVEKVLNITSLQANERGGWSKKTRAYSINELHFTFLISVKRFETTCKIKKRCRKLFDVPPSHNSNLWSIHQFEGCCSWKQMKYWWSTKPEKMLSILSTSIDTRRSLMQQLRNF